MMQRFPALLAWSALLALAACGGETKRHSDASKRRGAPWGFELAAAAAAQAEAAPVRELSPDEVARAVAEGRIRLIDIRTAEELAEDASIPGAEHIPMDQLDPSVLESADGREVVLYCRSGRRSEMAAIRLAEQTSQPVTHMPGGILAWQDQVRRAATCEAAGQQGC